MREILFRGKAINRDKGYHRTKYKNGDLIYGLVTRLYDNRFENLPAEMTDINGVSGIEVDYKTIGQYTGLTDKNGKKIFDDDILKNIESGRIIALCYSGCSFCYSHNGTIYGIDDSETGLETNEWEVIGNIHDNPELLKEAEQE